MSDTKLTQLAFAGITGSGIGFAGLGYASSDWALAGAMFAVSCVTIVAYRLAAAIGRFP